MKSIINKLSAFIFLIIAIGFASCNDSTEDLGQQLTAELTIQNKTQLLESSEWLLSGFETNVMHTFKNGKRFTHYGVAGVFPAEPIPGTEEYTITGGFLTIDFNFGNVYTYELKVSCDTNIVEFYRDGELQTTLYKKSSDYKQCL
ncbi:hypothetical protein [Polaribacter glomeratus]|uniref:Uncharacterized protein n=1 Tax=Polaribacter glomeratus TaxID=102 RepID=A0A2S7WI92_9FLAO|nr:hypothetical protein [Polaribacter glomeratus]PQJ77328.1 hypothetical protein BTO16_15955 [Polaribacter glomeratus]TXD65913.1 hypothetical protein ESX12_07060 [Polaribacter glomeratus]